MSESSTGQRFSSRTTAIIWWFAAGEVILHLYTNAFAGYGYFRDELYYVACSNHLAAGYVDHPPLSIFLLFLSIRIFGESIFALRLLPAITSGVKVMFGGLMTRKLGGGPFAVFLACLSLALAPQFVGSNSIYSMNTFDWLFWSAAAYIVVLIIENDSAADPKRNRSLWIRLGVILGLGLLNKIDILWFGTGLFFGLILTSHRKHLRTIWPYAAAAIALLIFSPYIIWNATHNFATLEFIRNASSIKYSSQNPATFMSDAFRSMNMMALPVWLAGIYFLFFDRDGKRFRMFGTIFVAAFLILIINWHSKSEYIAPAFPIIIAGGGVMFGKIVSRRLFGWVRYAMPALVGLFGIVTIPFALAVLPVGSFIEYSQALGIQPETPEGHKLTSLPQFYADMFGWENMASTVSEVYLSLPPEERKHTVVFGRNYGEAGAIDFFRMKHPGEKHRYPLPPAISGHNSYWFWGPGDTTFTTVIVIGGKKEDHLKSCDSVEVASTIRDEYAMPYENDLSVFICRHLKIPVSVLWQRVRFFI